MQRQGGLIRPSSVLLTTGLLMMAASPMFAAGGVGLDNGPKIMSVTQDGRTVTVTVSDEAGELIGANVIVKGTTNGNVTDMNGQVTLQNVPENAILEMEISEKGVSGSVAPSREENGGARIDFSEDRFILEVSFWSV